MTLLLPERSDSRCCNAQEALQEDDQVHEQNQTLEALEEDDMCTNKTKAYLLTDQTMVAHNFSQQSLCTRAEDTKLPGTNMIAQNACAMNDKS